MRGSAEVRRRIGAGLRFAGWSGAAVALTGLTLLGGVGVAVLVGRQGETEAWARWSNVGQTFGALSSVISFLGLAVLVITGRLQFREMREHRRELEQQRSELRRSVETEARNAHMRLLEMAINDPALAAVWPKMAPDAPAERNRQLLYANLIYQHVRVGSAVAGPVAGQALLLSTMRDLFTSPVMRDFWRVSASARAALPPDSDEFRAAQLVDDVYRECEADAHIPAEPQPGEVAEPVRR